jgi:hypothetical protein
MARQTADVSCLSLYFRTAHLRVSRPVTQLQKEAEYYEPRSSQQDSYSLLSSCIDYSSRDVLVL